MELLEQLGETFVSNWQTLLLTILLFLFAIPELVKKLTFFKEWLGYETPDEKRFKQIEQAQKQLFVENNKLKAQIDLAEQECMNAIADTETKFDDREQEHWEESKMIRHDYDSKIDAVDAKLDIILERLNRQDQLDLKKLRHSIVKDGEEAIAKGSITIRSLRSLTEMFEEYTNTYHGNSYVSTLMTKVNLLPVVGKLDEHGQDIE